MKILVADDDASVRASIILTMSDDDYEFIEAGNLQETERCMADDSVDLVILDIHFGQKTSLPLIEKLSNASKLPPTVILSGAASAKESADAIRYGAYDFIEKPISKERLNIAIMRCMENNVLKQSIKSLSGPINARHDILGNSEQINSVRRLIKQYSPKDVKVLITGETGTGKELIARAVWRSSLRKNGPFIVVNSAAIPDELIESELFGHTKGSFTGAHNNQIGKIEMANKGTLFLDEIGDLSLKAQTKLLRFLESGEIQPLGSNKIKSCDVRVIAATSRDLLKEMDANRFREDLYFRLNVARIESPALRLRRADISLLFKHFMDEFCSRYEMPRKKIDDDVNPILMEYRWPGNIRELRNIAERLVLITGEALTRSDIENLIGPSNQKNFSTVIDKKVIIPLKEYKKIMEKEYIERVLELCENSVAKAAKKLVLDRTYLHQKMNQLGIKK